MSWRTATFKFDGGQHFEVIPEEKKMRCALCSKEMYMHASRAKEHFHGDKPCARFRQLTTAASSESAQTMQGATVMQGSTLAQIATSAVDQAVASCVMCLGLPLTTTQKPEFVRMLETMRKNARALPAGYQPPGKRKLVSLINAQARDERRRVLESAAGKGVSLMMDGSRVSGKQFLVIYIATVEGNLREGMEVKEEAENAEIVLEKLLQLEQTVCDSVNFVEGSSLLPPVAAATLDGAPWNKRALRDLSSKRPRLFGQLCQAHAFSTLSKKIAGINAFSEIVDDAHDVIKTVKNSYVLRRALADSQTERGSGPDRKLLPFCNTRFVYTAIALRRLVFLKEHLMSLADEGGALDTAVREAQPADNLLKVMDSINSKRFWNRVTALLDILDPVLVACRLFDYGSPGSVAWVVYVWDIVTRKVLENARSADSRFGIDVSDSYLNDIGKAINRTSEYYLTDIHDVAAALNPCALVVERDVDAKALAAVSRRRFSQIPGFEDLVPELETFMRQRAQHMYEDLSIPSLWSVVLKNNFGCALVNFATWVTSQPASMSVCERDWSAAKHVLSSKRNRLDPELADTVVDLYGARAHSRPSPPPSKTTLTKTKIDAAFASLERDDDEDDTVVTTCANGERQLVESDEGDQDGQVDDK